MTISGGMPTIFVSDMDAAVRFYIEALGLKLLERDGDHWASIDAGHGLTIGLHPASAQNPAGRVGSMTIGFRSSEPIRETLAKLKARGVVFRVLDALESAAAPIRVRRFRRSPVCPLLPGCWSDSARPGWSRARRSSSTRRRSKPTRRCGTSCTATPTRATRTS